MSPPVRRAALIVAGVLAGFLFLETALRVRLLCLALAPKLSQKIVGTVPEEPERVWTQWDPELGWKNKPDAFCPRAYGPDISVRINGEGMRGERDFPLARTPGRPRVLFIGDSVPFGHGVADDRNVSSLLARDWKGAEVMNMSVIAYGIDQVTLLYEREGRRYKPDLVIYGLIAGQFGRIDQFVNDFGYARPKFILDGGRLILTNVPLPRRAAVGEARCDLNRLSLRQLAALMFRPGSETVRSARGLIARLRGPVERGRDDDLGMALLERLRRDVAGSGGRLVIMLCPNRDWLFSPKPDPFETEIASYCRARGVHLLDLTPVFRGHETADLRGSLFVDNDGRGHPHPNGIHWSERGNRLAERALWHYLRARRLAAGAGGTS